MIECCLYLPFVDYLTREARGGGRRVSCPAGARAPAGFLFSFSKLLRFFVSSFLRAEPWARLSATVNPCVSVFIRGLESEPNRPLHDPRVSRRRRLAEVRVDQFTRRIELGVGIDRRPIHLVEHVVHLPAELD